MRDYMARDRLATRSALGLIVLIWILMLIFQIQPSAMAIVTGVILLALQGVRYQLGVPISILTSLFGIFLILLGLYTAISGGIEFWHKIIPWTTIITILLVVVMLFTETFYENRLN